MDNESIDQNQNEEEDVTEQRLRSNVRDDDPLLDRRSLRFYCNPSNRSWTYYCSCSIIIAILCFAVVMGLIIELGYTWW